MLNPQVHETLWHPEWALRPIKPQDPPKILKAPQDAFLTLRDAEGGHIAQDGW